MHDDDQLDADEGMYHLSPMSPLSLTVTGQEDTTLTSFLCEGNPRERRRGSSLTPAPYEVEVEDTTLHLMRRLTMDPCTRCRGTGPLTPHEMSPPPEGLPNPPPPRPLQPRSLPHDCPSPTPPATTHPLRAGILIRNASGISSLENAVKVMRADDADHGLLRSARYEPGTTRTCPTSTLVPWTAKHPRTTRTRPATRVQPEPISIGARVIAEIDKRLERVLADLTWVDLQRAKAIRPGAGPAGTEADQRVFPLLALAHRCHCPR